MPESPVQESPAAGRPESARPAPDRPEPPAPERPLTIPRLALANILAKPWRAAGLAALVSVFSFALFAGALIDRQLTKGLASLSERLGADLLIVPYGYEAAAKSALLRGEPSTYYMSSRVLEKLRDFPGVAAATPQFYLASLSTECCSERVQIIAYDPESDFLIKPWLSSAAGRLGDSEIVVGSKLNVGVGEGLFFFGEVHTVVAQMAPTGMGLDTSVFMPLANVRKVIGSVAALSEQMPDPEAVISTVAIKIDDGLKVKDVANAIMRAEAIEFNLDLVLPDAIVTETARRLSGWSSLTGWLSAGLWLLALLALALVFSVSAAERGAEFGVYRLLGATRGWLGRLLLAEAAAVAAAGALAGLILAALVVFPFNALIFGKLGLPGLPLSASEIAVRALAGAALGAAVAPLASLRAVWRLTRVDVAKNLRSDA